MIRWAAAFLAAATPAAALDFGALSPAEREAFEAEIKALFLSEPELIERALAPERPDPMSFYIEEDKRRLSALEQQLAPQAGDVVIGPEGAPTVTAFLGPDEGSKEMAAVLKSLLVSANSLRIIVKFWGQNGRGSAIHQIYGADAFWRAMAGETDPNWDRAAIKDLAATLDTDRSDLAKALEMDAPPFLLINGIMVKGPVPPVVIQKYLSK